MGSTNWNSIDVLSIMLNGIWQNLIMTIFGICVLALGFSIAKALWNIYLHPLAKYPGSRLAAASRVWYCYHCLRGQLPFVLTEQHEKYGKVVRIAPDELSYTSPEGWNQIYGHRPGKSEIMKDPKFYTSLSSGLGSIINADRVRHGTMRKQMSHGFSERALRDQESVLRSYADLLINRIKTLSKAGSSPVDMVIWFNYFTFDVMGDLVFGESFGCLEKSDYHPWVKLIFDSVKSSSYIRCSKYWSWLTPIIQYFVLPEKLKQRRMELQKWAKGRAEYRKSLKTDRLDLISGFLKPDSGITHQEYLATVQTVIIAGSETTATLLSGVTYFLLKNPEKLKKLAEEIRTSFTSADEINFVSVNKLSYLLACLNEALRLYPPVPDAFPRNTGENWESICGMDVPPNTVIRMTHYATYHSPGNFTKPDDFIPERWLDGEGSLEFSQDKRSALQPFQVGPRNCIGRNLAYVEMRLLMALVLWNFDMELLPESQDWIDHKVYLLWEKPKLMVNLKPRAVA